jgi:molybdenum storage protein
MGTEAAVPWAGSGALVEGDGRTHIHTALMGASLVQPSLVAATQGEALVAMLPTVTVLAIGGGSLMDRGAPAVLPLVEELVEARRAYELVVGVSGGARLRHVFSVALDLGLPTGGLAQLAGACEEQNVAMLQQLLARHNAVMLKRDDFADVALYLRGGMLPLVISVPPYHYWEPPPQSGRLPENGSDLGMLLTAEALGAPRLILLKDQDGLYDADPVEEASARLIPEISAGALLAAGLPSLPFDRAMVETLQHTRFVREVVLINGLRRGALLAALRGEAVGSRILAGGV